VSTSGQLNVGLAHALDAKTGKVLWRFQETKNPAERSAGGTLGTGGAWNTPAIGPDGTVFFGIANPYRSIDQQPTIPPSFSTTTAPSRSHRAATRRNELTGGGQPGHADHRCELSQPGKPEIVAYSLNAPAGGPRHRRRRPRATAPAGAVAQRPPRHQGTAIQVQGGEFFFRLSTKSLAKPGTVTFVFKNIGHVAHDFQINGKQTPLIQPGQTANLVVSFTKNGKYPYLCTVPGHAEAGLKGVFTVG
jgi:plastocyanin